MALTRLDALMVYTDALERRCDSVFNEEDHPRAEDGKFGKGHAYVKSQWGKEPGNKNPVEVTPLANLLFLKSDVWSPRYWGERGEHQVNRIAEKLKAGVKFPALEGSRRSDGKIVINNGNHRYEAAKRIGMTEIPVHVSKTPYSGEDVVSK